MPKSKVALSVLTLQKKATLVGSYLYCFDRIKPEVLLHLLIFCLYYIGKLNRKGSGFKGEPSFGVLVVPECVSTMLGDES